MNARAVLTLAALSLGTPPICSAAAIESYAFVRADATLEVAGKLILLHGIHVPETTRTCRTTLRPVRCAQRAALALDFKIQGFVRCIPRLRYRDRSISAVCRVDGEDLGAYLISQGWAMAAPGAPFDYVARERIARHRGLGVWGFHVDAVTSSR